jgi:segregation and condensation protein A
MYTISSEKFEGPLDLLLSLIENDKLNICEISLSKITDSYLSEVEKLAGTSEELSDFVYIAAKLLYIKSKELLPNIKNEEEDQEIADLESALLEYQKYKALAQNLEEILSKGERSYTRKAKPEKIKVFYPPQDLDNQKLWEIFTEVIKKIPKKPDEAVLETKKITLEEKKKEIFVRIKKGKVTFRSLFDKVSSKVDVIVTFLAVLEMIKQKEINVTQEKNFSDFSICLVI